MFNDAKYGNVQDAIIASLGRIGLLSEDEKKIVSGVDFTVQQIEANRTIALYADNISESYSSCVFLVSGFAHGYRITRNGKREVIASIPQVVSVILQARI